MMQQEQLAEEQRTLAQDQAEFDAMVAAGWSPEEQAALGVEAARMDDDYVLPDADRLAFGGIAANISGGASAAETGDAPAADSSVGAAAVAGAAATSTGFTMPRPIHLPRIRPTPAPTVPAGHPVPGPRPAPVPAPPRPALRPAPPVPSLGVPGGPGSPGGVDPFNADALKLVVGEASGAVTSGARDWGGEQVNRATTEGRNFATRFIKRLWQGNTAREWYHGRAIQRGREQMVGRRGQEIGASQVDIYGTHSGGDRAASEQAKAAAVERVVRNFLSGDADVALQRRGEDMKSLAGVDAGLETGLLGLVRDYAQGRITRDVLEAEKNRLIDAHGLAQRNKRGNRDRGLALADNVLRVAENAKAVFDHDGGMSRVDAALSAHFANLQMGVQGERVTGIERAVNSFYKLPGAKFVNETTVAVVASAVFMGANIGRGKLSAIMKYSGIAVGSALIAGVREAVHVRGERRDYGRERAMGVRTAADAATSSKRVQNMERTVYNMASAEALNADIAAALPGTERGRTATELVTALDALSAARLRVRLSTERDINLIEYSGRELVEDQKMALDIRIAEARRAVREALNRAVTAGGLDDAALVAAGLTADGATALRDLDALLTQREAMALGSIETDITAKDRAFRALAAKRIAGKMVLAAVIGTGIGVAIQEGIAAVDGNMEGVFEPNTGQATQTTLAHWVHGGVVGGDGASAPPLDELVGKGTDGAHAVLNVPRGWQLHHGNGGNWQLANAQGNVVDNHVTFDKNGGFSPETLHDLQSRGFKTDHGQPKLITTKDTYTYRDTTVSPHEYITANPKEFVHIHRDDWLDNNTPRIFDKNELRLDWGGENGSGIDANGNYVFNVMNMTPDGSYHGALSVNAQELIREGKMKIFLSVNRGTQMTVIPIGVDTHGNAVISANSFAAKQLFSAENGHAVFGGAFAEAGEVVGVRPDGSQDINILATYEGHDSITTLINHIKTPVHHHHEQTITTLTPPAQNVQPPWFVPILSRRGLEYPPRKAREAYYSPYYLGARGIELRPELRRFAFPYAPELAANPDVDLDVPAVVGRYRRGMSSHETGVVNSMARQLRRQPRATSPRVAVLIPAAAHQEGDNIYHTLEQYSLQQGVPRDDFEIIVFANAPKGQKYDKTLDEIRRFQNDHPGMAVRFVEKHLDPAETNIGWIRKTLTDTVLEDYSKRGIDLSQVMFVSNDADTRRVSPDYLKTIIDRAAAAPKTDAFLGFIDWEHDAFNAQPEVFVGTRLMQMLDIYYRRHLNVSGSSGANFAFRPGIYAAVGGYSAMYDVAEDVEFGRAIRTARSGSSRQPIGYLGRKSEIQTSARRALETFYRNGGSPAEQWSGTFGANDTLRNRTFNLTPFDLDDSSAVAAMIPKLERVINGTLRTYGIFDDGTGGGGATSRLSRVDPEVLKHIDRSFWALGLKVTYKPDGTVQITDSSELIDGMRRWRVRQGL